jgi:hypothetical protein
MDGLRSAAAGRDAVLARLHGLLLHAARQEAGRRNRWLRLNGPDRDDLARQAAADALTAITAQLDGFRGQSMFRTWASKFAMAGCRRRLAAASGRPGHCPSIRKTGTGSAPDSRQTSAQNGTSCSRRCAGLSMRTSAANSAQCSPLSRSTACPAPRWPPCWDPTATRFTRHYSKRAASCAPAWQLSGEILRTVRDLPGSVRSGWMICSPQILGMRGAI